MLKTVTNSINASQIQTPIALSGDVTLSNGNLVQGTAAKGFNFTANTPQAGMTSELLNWYEEGTFSPTVSGSTGGTATYFENSGMYTRIGNLVYFRLRIACSAVSSMTGSAQINGLPFTCKTGGGRNIVNPDAPQGFTGYTTTASVGGTFVSGSLIYLTDSSSNVISATNYTNTFGIDITGVYNV